VNTIQRATVNKNERGLLLRNGDFDRVLQPGRHWLLSPVDTLRIVRVPLDPPAFVHPIADWLLAHAPDVVDAEFVRAELGETQVGLRHENGVLVEVLPPGTRRLYWKGLVDVRVDVVDIAASPDVAPDLAARLAQTQLRARPVAGLGGVLQVLVPDHAAGLLVVDGAVVRKLAPGSHAFWRYNREVAVEVVDLRLQSVEVSGQDILTRDKVPVRVNLSATWHVADPVTAHAQLNKPAEHLYRELQFGLRAAVGTRTLDELLENRTVIDDVVTGHVRERLWAHGIVVDTAGVKDIVLPGEVKAILSQVVEATKAAEANTIRRREETAATRSLLNTAKVLDENPTALRLKELETLERIAERIDKISVFGGLDKVLDGLVKLR